MIRFFLNTVSLATFFFSLLVATGFAQNSENRPPAKTAATQDSANRIPPDFSINQPPLIIRADAYAGRPFGIGRVTFRMRQGDEMILRTGATLLTEKNNRILYPVQTQSQIKEFIRTVTGSGWNVPDDQHTILFLFKGNQPLELRLDGTGTTFQNVSVDSTKPNRLKRFMRLWWREFETMAGKQMEGGDYPGVVETYLTSMLRKRLGFEPPRRPRKKRDQLAQTFELLFDVEKLRNESIERAMSGFADNSIANQLLPPDIGWTPVVVENLPAQVDVEEIVKSVPEECFYLRFGTWQNQLWLQRLMEEFGGDLGRMIKLRGYKPKFNNKFLNQLAIQSTEFDELFGGRLIEDVALIGMDSYIEEGATIGVMLRAKNTSALNRNLLNKRKKFVDSQKAQTAKLSEIDYRGHKIQFLSTPDNRYRSFYVVHENNHLVATSLTLARRFVDVSEGDGALADSEEFRYARTQMPLAREDTVFVYLSTKFFQQLLSPHYQIELRRRNRVISDMQLLEAARLAASHEGLDFDDLNVLVQNGFIPEGFGQRPDNSSFGADKRIWSDSIRGRRGFFTPIADMIVTLVSQDEYDWFTERAKFFAQNINSLDPMIVGIKRFEHETKESVERVIFDARVAPFGEDKYGWLMGMLGPTLQHQIASSPEDIISLQASLTRSGGVVREPSNHHLFAAVQDQMDPSVDLRPTSTMQLIQTLREAPAYVGSWPNAGFLDWLPALGGEPDQLGYTYSRILGLWRLQWGDFSVIAFDRNRLEALKPSLDVVPSERPAQIRLLIGDLGTSRLQGWANSVNYRRSWETSIANTRLLNMLTQQFGISPEIALVVAEQLLNVNLVCSLGGEYQLYELRSGRKLWASNAWPSFANPELPVDYEAPLLVWFRGAQVEVTKTPTQFAVHGHLDIERQAADSQIKLPSFDVLKGFSNMFGVGAKTEESKKDSPTPNKMPTPDKPDK